MRFHDVNITVQQPNGNWIECNFEDDLLPVEENRYYPCLGGLPLLNVPTTSILVSEGNNLMSYGPVNYKPYCLLVTFMNTCSFAKLLKGATQHCRIGSVGLQL